jgi:hypothetical protein
MVRAVEFELEALDELDDLPFIARQLTVLAECGRVVCGQPDPLLWELQIGEKRVFYRFEEDEIRVISAESIARVRH